MLDLNKPSGRVATSTTGTPRLRFVAGSSVSGFAMYVRILTLVCAATVKDLPRILKQVEQNLCLF